MKVSWLAFDRSREAWPPLLTKVEWTGVDKSQIPQHLLAKKQWESNETMELKDQGRPGQYFLCPNECLLEDITVFANQKQFSKRFFIVIWFKLYLEYSIGYKDYFERKTSGIYCDFMRRRANYKMWVQCSLKIKMSAVSHNEDQVHSNPEGPSTSTGLLNADKTKGKQAPLSFNLKHLLYAIFFIMHQHSISFQLNVFKQTFKDNACK